MTHRFVALIVCFFALTMTRSFTNFPAIADEGQEPCRQRN